MFLWLGSRTGFMIACTIILIVAFLIMTLLDMVLSSWIMFIMLIVIIVYSGIVRLAASNIDMINGSLDISPYMIEGYQPSQYQQPT